MATAQAQGGMNRDTAVAEQLLGMTNQTGPWGSVNYTPSGSASYVDSTGKTITVPRYTQTTTLSPEQQAIFDKSQAAQSNIAGIAQEQSARIGDYLKDPFEFDNQDAADWAYDLASSRILPQQQQAESALRSRLINQGLRPGTQAWDAEMTRQSQANNDQLNQLMLTGRGQAFSEALATRNQPINEITALLSGSQVSNPASMMPPAPSPGVAGVDYTGLVQQGYQNKLAASNAAMGGLFGLAGTLGGAAIMSDRRMKTDIRRVGALDNGTPVYTFRYKHGGPVQLGVMAQEAPAGAVIDQGGVLYVDYGKVAA